MSNILTGFASWVKEQPPEKTYNFTSGTACAVGQYFTAIGQKFDQLTASGWAYATVHYHDGERTVRMVLPDGLMEAIGGDGRGPWTFGELAKRLEQVPAYI